MSRSNPNANASSGSKNPAKFFAEWNSTERCFKFYQKSEDKEKKGHDVLLPFPFRFLVLDELNTVKGFSKSNKSSFWSNEVRFIKTDILTIRHKNGIAATGLYTDIINLCKGAKFSKSVYVMIKEKDKEPFIANIHMFGSAIGQWIDFADKVKDNLYKMAVECKEYQEDKNGDIVFYKPVFNLVSCTEESNRQAEVLQQELQKYLKPYLSSEFVKEETTIEASDFKEDDGDNLGDFAPPIDNTDVF